MNRHPGHLVVPKSLCTRSQEVSEEPRRFKLDLVMTEGQLELGVRRFLICDRCDVRCIHLLRRVTN